MNQLYITFEGSRVSEDGVPVDGFAAALKGVQDAVRLMVEHLGERQPQPGPRPKWVRDQSTLRMTSTRPGSVVIQLTLEQPPEVWEHRINHGPRALEALLNWEADEDSTLPKIVIDRLNRTRSALPKDMRLWLGDSEITRRVEVKRTVRTRKYSRSEEKALLYGWLKVVNWNSRTAQLHRYMDSYVRLRFESALDEDMVRFATQYVEVRGRGRLNDDDRWKFVQVDEINDTRSWREPFDLEAFLNDPNPKIFDPDKLVTASEPFDADEFNRIIREGRDVRREGYSE